MYSYLGEHQPWRFIHFIYYNYGFGTGCLGVVLAMYFLLFSNVFAFDLAMYLLVGIEIPGFIFGI